MKQIELFTAKNTFYKPALANGNNTCGFYELDNKELWVLGEFLEDEQNNRTDCFLKYKFFDDYFLTSKIEIPIEIELGTSNFLQYDDINKIVYILSGIRFKNMIGHELIGEKIEFVLYTYSLQKNQWTKIMTIPQGLYVTDMKLDLFYERLIYFIFKDEKKYFYTYNLKNGNFISFNCPFETDSVAGYSIEYDGEKYLYFYGGFNKEPKCNNRLYRIDASDFNSFIEIKVEKMMGRTFTKLCYIKELPALFFYGGTPDGYDFTKTAYLYYIQDNRWESVPEIEQSVIDSNSIPIYCHKENRLFLPCSFKFDPVQRKYFYINEAIEIMRLI